MDPSQVNKIRILGKTWELRMFRSAVGDDDSCGLTHHDKLAIDIDACNPKEAVQDTLLHELIHAVDEELAGGMTEAQVSHLATGLLCVMKDNPALRKFIFE